MSYGVFSFKFSRQKSQYRAYYLSFQIRWKSNSDNIQIFHRIWKKGFGNPSPFLKKNQEKDNLLLELETAQVILMMGIFTKVNSTEMAHTLMPMEIDLLVNFDLEKGMVQEHYINTMVKQFPVVGETVTQLQRLCKIYCANC